MNKNIPAIYDLIQELSWYFGNQGFNGDCCGDLSLVEFMALKKVYENNDIAMQDIGDSLNITKSGATKIIDRLESKEYVMRKQSLADGRVCCVAITDKGMDAITQIVRRYTDYIGQALKSYMDHEVDNIKNVLDELVISVRKQGFIKSNQH